MNANELPDKIEKIYKPFLKLSIGFIAGYALLTWFLCAVKEMDLQDIVVDFWIPLLLPWIPVVIWLRPRIQLLDFTGKKGSPAFGYMLVAALTMTIPSVIARRLVASATGVLTPLPNIDSIDHQKLSRFYTLTAATVDKHRAVLEFTSDVSNKSRDLNLHLYVACPIYIPGQYPQISIRNTEGVKISPAHYPNQGAETTEGPDDNALPKAWYCLEFSEKISNKLENSAKVKHYANFYNKSRQALADSNLQSYTYLERIGNNAGRDNYRNIIQDAYVGVSTGQMILLEPQYGAFKDRNQAKSFWLIVSFLIGALLWYFMIRFTKLKTVRPDY